IKDGQGRKRRQAQIHEELVRAKDKAAQRWYVNGQGQTLVVVPGPVVFAMGSPEREAGRKSEEELHQKVVGRTFAIASTTVTVQQFEGFLKDNHKVRHEFNES